MRRRAHAVWILAVVGFAAGSCRSAAYERWEPYTGCDAAQCETWYEQCTADCLNTKEVTVTECRSRCGAKLEACRPACAG